MNLCLDHLNVNETSLMIDISLGVCHNFFYQSHQGFGMIIKAGILYEPTRTILRIGHLYHCAVYRTDLHTGADQHTASRRCAPYDADLCCAPHRDRAGKTEGLCSSNSLHTAWRTRRAGFFEFRGGSFKAGRTFGRISPVLSPDGMDRRVWRRTCQQTIHSSGAGSCQCDLLCNGLHPIFLHHRERHGCGAGCLCGTVSHGGSSENDTGRLGRTLSSKDAPAGGGPLMG